jgi:hypothetical protein
MWHVCGEYKCLSGLGWENLKEREHLQDLGIDARIILKYVLHDQAWCELIWAMIGAHSTVEICLTAEELSPFQEGLLFHGVPSLYFIVRTILDCFRLTL